ELDPRRRTIGESPLEKRERAPQLRRRDALLAETRVARPTQRRRDERAQPRVVLAADEVKRAAVQRRHENRPIGKRRLDVTRVQTASARADRKPETARILRLHREQPLDNRNSVIRGLARKQLRSEPLANGHAFASGLARTHAEQHDRMLYPTSSTTSLRGSGRLPGKEKRVPRTRSKFSFIPFAAPQWAACGTLEWPASGRRSR